jgi:hypothetical protein
MVRSFLGLACAGLLLSGCQGAITKEVRYPGGYPGSLLDKRTIDASKSKSVQVLRAAMIIAMASRMATATIKDGKDADAFVDYLAAAAQELNYSAANLYGVSNTPSCAIGAQGAGSPCQAYFVNFEADVPLLEGRIVRLMVASLPEDRAKKFLEDVAKGDVIGAAWSGIRTLATSANGLRHSAAVFRSNLELAAALNCATTYNQEQDTVQTAANTCFSLPADKIFSDKRITLTGIVPKNAFESVMLIAQTSCARLPLNTDGGAAAGLTRRNTQCDLILFKPAYRPARQN